MDSCPDGKEIDKSDYSGPSRYVRNMVFDRSGLVWIIAIGLAILMSTGSVFGQFTVQPMKMEIPVRSGKLVKSALEIRNIDANEVHTIDISVVELSQWEDGTWRIIEPNSIKDPNSPNFGFDLSTLSSCSKWISLSDNSVEIPPYGVAPVMVNLRVTRGIRGFYGAGILASVRPRMDAEIPVILRFLVPVIVEIQNRPMRHKVETTDVGMEPSKEDPAITMLSMSIENKGGTYSRLKPMARIWAFSDGHWRVITTTQFKDASIIPGANLKLETQIDKYLPSGKYRVAGVLYVDGRRTKRIQKEIDYVGSAKIEKVVADAPVDVYPTDIAIESLPGATRGATLTVFNASDETVNVQTALGLPHNLQIASFADVKGEDLNCTEWVKVTPEKFTLRGEGGKQNIRIITTMPNPAVTHPCYYSLLALWATFPDGQKAGVTTTKICVKNKKIEIEPEAEAMKLTLHALEGSKYIVVARFGNFKTIHFTPKKCRAGITTAEGIPRVSTLLSRSERGLMLPFERSDFSGVIDLSNLPADTYRLAAALEYGTDKVETKQIAIRVSIEGNQRKVEIVGTEEELEEIVEIKW
jgi:hypothetical protein